MKKLLPIILVITLFMSSKANSQTSIKVGGGFGLAVPAGDLGGSTVDYYHGKAYGLSTGYNLHGKVRVGLSGINIVGDVGYSSLNNDENSSVGKIELKQNILSLKVGPEYQIKIPDFPFYTYVGANIAINNFSGETKFNGVARVASGTYNVKSATRMGGGLNGGVLFEISNNLTLDLGLNYNFMNLVGKEWQDENPTKDQRIDSYLTLNDDKDPDFGKLSVDEHFISKARSIQTVMVTLSIMFGL